MPSNYDAIREENKGEYGTAIVRTGKTLLSGLYADRTHFIYEVLQNTEDALKKRGDEEGSSAINFALADDSLTISHYGKPFDEADVRGVCGIALSTKEGPSDIGRFGIGFKSVYAFTDRPEIHSADEHFAIESFVLPYSANEKALNSGETQIIIPFKDLPNGRPAMRQVLEGLRRLRPRTLLFLRQITEITWSVNGVQNGSYWRQKVEQLTDEACRVRVGDAAGLVEDWIVFSREVDASAGYIELAFALESQSVDDPKPMVRRLKENPTLVAFFPTELKTDLGFIVQGPYHTTPNRDNIQQDSTWNQDRIEATAELLVDALKGLRELGLLSVSALESLPLDKGKFAEGTLFAPMFQAVKEALLDEELLPAHNGGHIAGRDAKLGTGRLRRLITPGQLSELFQTEAELGWVNGDLTLEKAPILYNFLNDDEDGLGIDELDARWLISKLTPEFMALQTDDWVERLYEVLNRSWAREVLESLKKTPLLRLQQADPHKDALHNAAVDDNGNLQVYLPKSDGTRTGFATIKPSVCDSEEALAFLKGLGLREPGLVDDVIQNILPKYSDVPISVSDDEYRADLEQAIAAFASDAGDQQKKRLTDEIGKVKFALAVDAADANDRHFVLPGEAYWPTDSLKALFKGVSGVLLLDNNIVLGEAHNLLAAAGTQARLARRRVERELTNEQKGVLRLKVSDGDWTRRDHAVVDYTLIGLDALLSNMTSSFEQASEKAGLLWEALCEFSNQGDSVFNGDYRWYYRREKHAEFPACFVELLSKVKWVPNENRLQAPTAMTFADTGWEPNPSLAQKIGFQPSDVDELAQRVGIDVAVLRLLREMDITTLDKLQELLPALANESSPQQQAGSTGGQNPGGGGVQVSSGNTSGSSGQATPASTGQAMLTQNVAPVAGSAAPQGWQSGPGVSISLRPPSQGGSTLGSGGGNQANMDVERTAIKLILSLDPSLKWTMPGNPGFDLWEPGPNDSPVLRDAAEDRWELGPDDQPRRWIEVKSTAGPLSSVTMTGTQFEYALERQDDYLLYVVENATAPGQSRIFKIQNPAQKFPLSAFDFTLTRAWIEQHQS